MTLKSLSVNIITAQGVCCTFELAAGANQCLLCTGVGHAKHPTASRGAQASMSEPSKSGITKRRLKAPQNHSFRARLWIHLDLLLTAPLDPACVWAISARGSASLQQRKPQMASSGPARVRQSTQSSHMLTLRGAFPYLKACMLASQARPCSDASLPATAADIPQQYHASLL